MPDGVPAVVDSGTLLGAQIKEAQIKEQKGLWCQVSAAVGDNVWGLRGVNPK